ncbi:serine/threonine-protein kinase [Streptomyces sp. NPDC006514]|uniref:serine/threonine-protein kinase n=1 Tax=Streptomyces sp. NPDC006514 TaxID=3154308 RepID=UPI0033B1B324
MRGALLEGRYRLERRLGADGMGEVWQARDLRLDREVAVKVISRGVSGDHLLEERFRKEARTAAGLTHPRIVTVHDHGEVEVDGRPVLFLVMELVRGRPLTAVLRDHRSGVDPAAVGRWAVQICEGLAAAHRAGVVHRDIKPANIMVHGSAEADVALMSSSDVVDEDNHGLGTALAASVSIGVLLLFWPPAPWWVGVLVLLLSGVVLLFLSYLVQELVGCGGPAGPLGGLARHRGRAVQRGAVRRHHGRPREGRLPGGGLGAGDVAGRGPPHGLLRSPPGGGAGPGLIRLRSS